MLSGLENTGSISISSTRSVRIKITDSCQWNCKFCHNEGNIYATDLTVEDGIYQTIERLRNELGINEVHLTGGEPTLNKDIAKIVELFTTSGFKVKMTSNGQFRSSLLDDMKQSGLCEINISMQGFDPEEFISTQKRENIGVIWATRQIKMQIQNIIHAKLIGMRVKINTVISSVQDIPRILRVYLWCRDNGVEFRLLDDLGNKKEAAKGIAEFLRIIGAENIGISKDKCTSGIKYIFRDLEKGYEFKVKQIEPLYLDTMCNDCPNRHNGACQEGFYGIRIQKTKDEMNKILLCMQCQSHNTLMLSDDFFQSRQFGEISQLFDQ